MVLKTGPGPAQEGLNELVMQGKRRGWKEGHFTQALSLA